jgi:hypothetical protein
MAPNQQRRLFSALADVTRAIPAAKLLEITPDFVGLTGWPDLSLLRRRPSPVT